VYLVAFAVAAFGSIAGVLVWRAAASPHSASPHYYSTHIELLVAAYPDPDHAWVAGNLWSDPYSISGGTIRAGGAAGWREQMYSTAWSDPTAMAFANDRCGWLVGSTEAVGSAPPPSDSLFLATTDGGVTWKKQFCPGKYVLTGVACANASHAWAVGGDMRSGGAIYVTRGGGAHWQRQYVTEAGDLWAVSFADARHGYAVGDGVILATSDGGVTWRQRLVKGCFLRSVACGDARRAWAVGSGAANRDLILATADGGITWHVQHTGAGPNAQGEQGYSAVASTDAEHGWVVGDDGTILATADGGRTWKQQQSGTRLDLMGVAFADARHGIVVGRKVEGDDPLAGKLDGSIILRTSDGGATWTN
jgi:photosystem II stability/assembly factor-like uncharacterized protein